MGASRRAPRNTALASRRVALVCFSRSYGGLEMTTVRTAALLKTRGAEVVLIVPPASPLAEASLGGGFSVEPMEPRLTYGDLSVSWRLASLFRSRRISDTIFLRSKDLHLGALARLVHREHRMFFYQQMQSGIRKTDLLHRAVFSQLAGWWTLTETMRREVLTWTTMPPERVAVVPIGRDAGRFRPGHPSRSEARKRLGLPARALIVGVLGRLDRQKGQQEFIRTYPAVRRQHARVVYVIAGDETKNDPGMRRELERVARETGFASDIRILPPTDNIAGFMSALDIFAMPSYSETYGLVLIEAMAMGIPVIATRSGGVPDLVGDGREGLLVEPKDVEGLAAAIGRLAGSLALRRRMGKAGRDRFLAQFREERCIDRMVAQLDQGPAVFRRT